MVEAALYSKNKINLSDYNYQRDIQNRILMAQFSEDDIALLEEMIYSPARISLTELSNQIDKSEKETLTALKRLSLTPFFKQDGDTLIIDKEARKYFEFQLIKFKDNFTPGLDFLQLLLKKVPLDVLLNWYPIPRTSNNIFQSLIDKYLKKPSTFQRYLIEIDFENPLLNGIKEDLSSAPNRKLYADEVKEKYHLTAEAFEEAMLYLEFNFICCLSYEKRGKGWVEVVTFFREWEDYILFFNDHKPQVIDQPSEILPTRQEEFSFVEDLSTLLKLAFENKLYVELDRKERWLFERQTLSLVSSNYQGFHLNTEEGQELFFNYLFRMIQKLLLIKFATLSERVLVPSSHSKEWLALPIDKRALNLYKLTLRSYSFSEFPSEICTERIIREIEKTVGRISDGNWVLFEDFMGGLIASISDNNKMELKQKGRQWKYILPTYSSAEQALIKKIIYDYLFEAGVVATGTYLGKECLRITSFGKALFG